MWRNDARTASGTQAGHVEADVPVVTRRRGVAAAPACYRGPSAGSWTGGRRIATRRAATRRRITCQDGSNSQRRMLNFGDRACAWWLLWRLSPPVTQAITRELYAVLSKF